MLMKVILLFYLTLLLKVYAKAQDVKYLNTDGKEISTAKFNAELETRKYLAIKTDAQHRQLIERYQTGLIPDFSNFKTIFNRHFPQALSNSPLVIIYYPGEDPCNNSGSATAETKKDWYGTLDKGVKKQIQSLPIYICKNKNDMDDRGSAVLNWNNDPEYLIERTFFKHHYPCGSFVVISPNGKYISYFGEYSKEQVWTALKAIK